MTLLGNFANTSKSVKLEVDVESGIYCILAERKLKVDSLVELKYMQ